MLLHHAKVDYEFIGHTFEGWGELKKQGKSGEFDGLPRWTINGKEYQDV